MARVARGSVAAVVAAVLVSGAALWGIESTLAGRSDVVRTLEASGEADDHQAFLRSLVGLTVSEARDVLDGPASHAPGAPVVVLRDPSTRPETALISAACFTEAAERVTVEVANRHQLSAADWHSAKRDPAQPRVSSCAERR